MSGIEVLGVVLGVLPLVITALEHYEDTLRPIKTYRNFTMRAQQFCDQLDTQRTIFRAECELLLSTVANRATAREMLNDPNHENWKSAVISDLLGRCLGSLGTACASVIAKMNTKLVEIGDFYKTFHGIPSIPTSGPSLRRRDWTKRVRSKLKLAFSEPKLRESIAELDALNTTFRTLSNQVIRFNNQASIQEKQSQGTSAVVTDKKTRDLKTFQTVSNAARLLLHALNRACTVHKEHFAKFSLEVSCVRSDTIARLPSQVLFNLIFSHSQLTRRSSMPPQPSSQCLRFEVESLLGDEQSIRNFYESRMSRASIGGALTEQKLAKGKGKAVEIEPTILLKTEGPSITRITTTTIISPQSSIGDIEPGRGPSSLAESEIQTSINLQPPLSNGNLCSSLQEMHMQTRSSSPNTYVTILEETTTSNHLIYYPTQSHFEDPSIPLTQALGPIEGVFRGGIPQYLRLCIARSLSVAVLQFHGTPWFETSWHSENVCFIEDKSKPGFPVINSPYLIVHMGLEGDNPSTSKIQGSQSKGVTLAPNNVLFSLGIMLVELAYGAAFQSLLEPSDLEVSEDINVVRFIAARRLADSVGTYLGPRYARLVRKCLRCDFGSGEDLETLELQERLYEDVICQLDGLEQGFRQLQADS